MWHAYGIIVDFYLENGVLNLPLDIGSGVKIEAVPEWINTGDYLDNFSPSERDEISCAKFAFSTSYAAEAIGSRDLEWKGQEPRSIQSAIDEKFSLAGLALWISKPSKFSCGPKLHFEVSNDPGSFRQSSVSEKIRVSESESEGFPSEEDFASAKDILKALLSLERSGNVFMAIKILLHGLQDSVMEIRYLSHWIVLESLFGPEETNETTYRLSQRICFFLRDKPDDRNALFKEIKKCYQFRSKIVHGMRSSKSIKNQQDALLIKSESLIRESLARILTDASLVSAFDGKGRDEYLESLIFGNLMP